LPNRILNGSDILDLKAGSDDYRAEGNKNRRLEHLAGNFALEVSFLNLSEFLKSGARLSGLVMHLNRRSYGMARVGGKA